MEFNEYGFSPFPDFFRIYNSHEHSQRLVFPSGYKKYYPTPLPQTVVLKTPEGNFWNVKWRTSQDDTISFEDGWKKFVIDNGILEEDYVLFTYDGFRVFWVRIYRNGLLVKPESPIKIQEISDDEDETIGGDTEKDSNGNEIISLSLGSSSDDDVDDDDHDTEEDSNGNKIISLSLGSSSDEDYDVDDDDDDTMICEVNKASNGSSIKGESSRGRGGWTGDPEMYLDDPKNPYFISTLSGCRPVLVIAMQVRKDFELKFGRTVNFIDGFGVLERKLGEWKDRLVVHKWEEIYKRNNIKPGDTIICEILRERGVVHSIKVHFVKK